MTDHQLAETATIKPSYTYNVEIVRVLDGDTVIVDVSCGFFITVRMSCRLVGINAIELHDPGGAAARDHLANLLAGPLLGPTVVQSVGVDKFAGRFDAVLVAAGVDVNARMVADGYAAAWDGTGPRPTPPWPIPEAKP